MTAAAVERWTPRRVLIAADPVAMRVGLRLALEPEVLVTEVADPDSAVAVAIRDQPDVCLLDHRASGFELRAVSEIVSRVPFTTVIVLADDATEEEFIAAIRAGASGYLPLTVDPARLLPVVRGVLSGEPAVPRRFVGWLLDEVRGRDRRRLLLSREHAVQVTSREWEVLELFRLDLKTNQIAARLGISQVTVRRHLSSVGQKLGVSSRADVRKLLDGSDEHRFNGANGD
jgi:DNA-binding NarL/FixJ family response regulator